MYSVNWSEVLHLGQENQKNDVLSSVHHVRVFMVLTCLIPGDVYLGHLGDVMVARFLYYRVTFFFFYPFVLLNTFEEIFLETIQSLYPIKLWPHILASFSAVCCSLIDLSKLLYFWPHFLFFYDPIGTYTGVWIRDNGVYI